MVGHIEGFWVVLSLKMMTGSEKDTVKDHEEHLIPEKKSSQLVCPMNGIAKWVCGSIPPAIVQQDGSVGSSSRFEPPFE